MSITVINTRPSERAAPLSAHLQASGMTVVDMPMLALNPLAVSEQSIDLMRRWQAGDYQALVVVSPTAAALGLEVWHKLGHKLTAKDAPSKTPSPIIAVGAATAAVLHAADCEVRQPKVANNEGMLMMPEIAGLHAGDKLLIWRGLGKCYAFPQVRVPCRGNCIGRTLPDIAVFSLLPPKAIPRASPRLGTPNPYLYYLSYIW